MSLRPAQPHSLAISSSLLHAKMFWFYCLQVSTVCVYTTHSPGFYSKLNQVWSAAVVNRSACLWPAAVLQPFWSYSAHINQKVGSLSQTDVSHPSPSHFSVSMAFLTFFVTSLAWAAIHTWRVNGGGRRRELAPLDAGPQLPSSVPYLWAYSVSTDPIRSQCPTFCLNTS